MKSIPLSLHTTKMLSKVFLLAIIFSSTPPSFAVEPLEDNFSSVEERRIHSLINQEKSNIQRDKKALELRKNELKTIEASVDKKIDEIDKKLEDLKELQKKIESLLAEKSNKEKKRIKDLSTIYEKMVSAKAALAIGNMDSKLATELLANMKPKAAAKILNMLDKQKASQLSTTFTTIQLE